VCIKCPTEPDRLKWTGDGLKGSWGYPAANWLDQCPAATLQETQGWFQQARPHGCKEDLGSCGQSMSSWPWFSTGAQRSFQPQRVAVHIALGSARVIKWLFDLGGAMLKGHCHLPVSLRVLGSSPLDLGRGIATFPGVKLWDAASWQHHALLVLQRWRQQLESPVPSALLPSTLRGLELWSCREAVVSLNAGF
jgi:hypothetical protein